MEIERKFLVKAMPPDLEKCEACAIIQGYIAIDPDGTEVRIRKRGEDMYLTAKSGGTLSREEVEIELSAEEFLRFWRLTETRRIEKKRYVVPSGTLTFELDVFAGVHQGLAVVEVEFSSIEDSAAFAPPAWFGAEVTNDKRFKNKQLAQTKTAPNI